MKLLDLDLIHARRGLLAKEFSCEEYATELVAHTQKHMDLHGWAEFDPQALLQAARTMDQKGIATDAHNRLGGVPLGVKDNIDVMGMRSTAGTGALADRKPTADAGVISAVKSDGALIAGKTITHELAMGITSNNGTTGAARNPYDPSRSPGGSSGGSGTVVSARMVPAALGTDTGGSVRVPAAFCGIAGLRPTVGRYPGHGVLPISRTRDTVGPLARSVADLALLDAVIARDDALPEVSLSELKIGVPVGPYTKDIDPVIAQLFDQFVKDLRSAGVTIVEKDIEHRDELNSQIGFPIVLFEFERDMLAMLAAEGNPKSLQEIYEGIGSPDVAMIVKQQLGPDKITRADYEDALRRRSQLQRLFADHFRDHSLHAMIYPTCPLTAPIIGEDVTIDLNGRQEPTFLTYIRHTDPGSVAGLPGVSIPLGMVNGLPVGLSIEGLAHSDRFILSLSQAFERMLPPIDPPKMAS